MKHKLLWVIILGLSLVAAALAQTTGARLSGTVTDLSGALVPNAAVSIRNQDTGIVETATTGPTGMYLFRTLPPGTYEIRVECTGFQTLEEKGLVLRVGQDLGYDLQLKVGAVREVINVEATTPLVESQKGAIDSVITHRQLDNLPTNSRYFLDLAYLTAGVLVNQGTNLGENISVNGQRGFANAFNIDGVNNQESYLQSVRTPVSQDSIQEFQVLTHQMEPQYGQASGAVINVATRSGTNDFHGTAYGFFRNGAMDALNAYTRQFDNTKPDTHRDIIGGTFGGPVIKEKLFFFGSYEWLQDLQAVTISAPEEAGQIVAEGPTTQTYLARVDYNAGNNTYYFRYSGYHTNGFWGPGGTWTKSTAYSEIYKTDDGVFNWNRMFSPTVLGEFRAQFSYLADVGDPVTPSGPNIQRPSSVSGKWITLPFNVPEYTGQLIYNLSVTKGTHDMKFGANYERIENTGSNRNFGDGVYYFDTDAPYNASDPSTWPYRYYQRIGPSSWDVPENVMGFFAQDKWSIKRNLTLTYGVRWDYENFFSIVPPAGTLLNYIPTPGNGKPVQNPKNEFGPRVSLAWSPWDSKTVFRAGYGLFWGRVPTNEAALVVNNTINTLKGMIVNLFYPPDTITFPTPPSVTAVPQNSSAIDVLDNNLRLQRTSQYTFGVQRQLTSTTALTVDFVRVLGDNLWTLVNRNATDPITGLRADPNYRQISAQSSIGQSWYTGMEVTLKHATPKHTFTLAYTLSKNIDDIRGDPNGPGVTCSQWINLYGNNAIRCDRGLSNNDVRNRLVFNGTFNLPFRFIYSSILSAQGGVPYSIAAGRDLNGDDYTNDRPPGVSRNTLRTDGFFSWDNRISRKFVFHERYSTELFAEAFNTTNTANYNGYIGNVLSSLFMQPTGASDPRRWQFGFRFAF